MTREERKLIKYKLALTNDPEEARKLYNLIKPKTYQQRKEEARQEAIDFQTKMFDISVSYLELSQIQNYFKELGKKYGLLKEFKENGII